MSDQGFSFRWGIPSLDRAGGGLYVFGFMLRNYARLVTRSEFLLILHFASFHFESEHGESRPSAETIRKLMGYRNVDSVYQLTRTLKEKGMLKIKNRPGKTSIVDGAGFANASMKLDGENIPYDPSHGLDHDPNHTEEEEGKKKLSSEKNPLDIDLTKAGKLLLKLMNANREAKRQNAIKRYGSLPQRDAFLTVFEGVSLDILKQWVTNALVAERLSKPAMLAYLKKCKSNKGRTHTNGTNQNGTSQADSWTEQEAADIRRELAGD